MENSNLVTEFKTELKALLAKYKAEINAELDGDTHGVSCDLVITIGNKEVIRSVEEITHHSIKL